MEVLLETVEHKAEQLLSKHIKEGGCAFVVDAKAKAENFVKPLQQLKELRAGKLNTLVLVSRPRRLQQLSSCFDAVAAVALPSESLELTTLDCLVLDAQLESNFETLKQQLLQLTKRIQLLMSVDLWQATIMMPLMQQSSKPLLLFKDALQAAGYAGVQLHIELAESLSEQQQQLLQYLQHNAANKQRTLVYCADEAQLLMLQQLLPQQSWLLHSGRQHKASIERWQQQHAGKILLLSCLSPELRIQNVHTLIHFSMPSTWNQFKQRFAVFKAHIEALERPTLQTLVLLDKRCTHSLPQLLQFKQQHEQLIPEPLWQAHEQLQSTLERDLVTRQCVLCPLLLLYGRCLSSSTCQYRHMLSAKDTNCDTVPTAGSVQFKLLKICTPTHFAARLLAHKTSNSSHWTTLDCQQCYEQLQQQLSSYFATSDNCIMPLLPQLSDVCVRRLGPNGYERVAITHVPQAANTDGNAVLRVKHLDLNTVICHAKLSELLVCPPTLQQIAPLALDLRLSGIVPSQGEEIWQRCDNVSIGKLLHVGAVYEAQVDFGLSHAIFVKDLQLPSLGYVRQLSQLGLAKFDANVRQRLKLFMDVARAEHD